MITLLGFGLCVLAALFTLATVLVVAITIQFRQPGLLVLAAIFAVITALLIGAAAVLP